MRCFGRWSDIENELNVAPRASLKDVAIAAMQRDPRHWKAYYTDPSSEKFDLQYSLSDRIRYYWNVAEVSAACDALLANLSARVIPLTLLSQYLPRQYAAIREGSLTNDPRALLLDGSRPGPAELCQRLSTSVSCKYCRRGGVGHERFWTGVKEIDDAGAHWTAREISQQPQMWKEIEKLIARETARLATFLTPLLKLPDIRIVLTGAGTSAHIGTCLAPALALRLSRRVDAIPTTDLVASPQSYLSASVPTLVVSFGRSGNSPESVAAVEVAEAYLHNCSHLIFTCDRAGALYKRATGMPNGCAVLLPEACNDRSFAMTSSFTGMLLAAGLTVNTIAGGSARMAALANLAARVLPGSLELLQALVRRNFTRVVYLGSKEFKGLAQEAALKMLELTDGKVVAIGDSPLAFRHGPKTIVNSSTLVVVFVSNDAYTRQYDLDLVNELRRDGVADRAIALMVRSDISRHADDLVLETAQDSPSFSDVELCLPYAVFAQSLALLRSLSVGVQPDSPNAAGTVSRVVKGVLIHPWRGST